MSNAVSNELPVIQVFEGAISVMGLEIMLQTVLRIGRHNPHRAAHAKTYAGP